MINDNYLFAYVWRRMREMGFNKYHVETATVELTAAVAKKEVKAYNEYYYLVSKNVPDDTIILSDTNYLKTKDHSTLELHSIQEFSGSMTLQRGTSDTRLEFLRVIVEK